MTISDWKASKKSGPAAAMFPGDLAQRRNAVAEELHAYQELKSSIHRKLIDRLDLSTVSEISPEQLSGIIKTVVEALITAEGIPLTRAERERLVVEIQHETLGLGPLEPLLQDPEISDIMVNGPGRVYIEKHGKLHRTEVTFKDDEHLMTIIERIVSKVGRRVDESTPLVDARLRRRLPRQRHHSAAGAGRAGALHPPLRHRPPEDGEPDRQPVADGGDGEDIRRDGAGAAQHPDLGRHGRRQDDAAEHPVRVDPRRRSGSSRSRTRPSCILQQEHVVRLETRPSNIEGKGTVTQRDLVRNALRMRPDRIIVGEVRGGEALDMLQAMNTGHDGSISTIHANSPRDALSRLETMVLMAGFELPSKAIREQVSRRPERRSSRWPA